MIRIKKLSLAAVALAALIAPLASGQEKSPAKTEAEKSAPSKDGKKYVERKTPFGTARYEDKPEVKKAEPPPPNIHAFDEGGNVRFERKSPFGLSRWVKKKSEMDEMERAVWERDCGKPATSQPAKK